MYASIVEHASMGGDVQKHADPRQQRPRADVPAAQMVLPARKDASAHYVRYSRSVLAFRPQALLSARMLEFNHQWAAPTELTRRLDEALMHGLSNPNMSCRKNCFGRRVLAMQSSIPQIDPRRENASDPGLCAQYRVSAIISTTNHPPPRPPRPPSGPSYRALAKLDDWQGNKS